MSCCGRGHPQKHVLATQKTAISVQVCTLYLLYFLHSVLLSHSLFLQNLHFFSAVEQQFPASATSQSQICAINRRSNAVVPRQNKMGNNPHFSRFFFFFLHLVLSTAPHQSASVPVHHVGSTLIQISCRQHTDYRLRTSKNSHVK